MVRDPKTGALAPADIFQIRTFLPEMIEENIKVDFQSFPSLVDSSDVGPESWLEMALMVGRRYLAYDGFVILHGTDTMSYSASALSFMLENLN